MRALVCKISYSLMPIHFSCDLCFGVWVRMLFSHLIQCVRVQRNTAYTYFLCACYDFLFFYFAASSSSFYFSHFTQMPVIFLTFSFLLQSFAIHDFYVKLYDKVFIWLLFFDWRCSNRNRSHSVSEKEIEEGA